MRMTYFQILHFVDDLAQALVLASVDHDELE